VVDEQQLKQCPGGSYHVSINLPGIDHFSFTDKPFIDSDKKEDVDDAVRALRAIEAYTIAFFDRYLKQEDQKLLNPSVAALTASRLRSSGRPNQLSTSVHCGLPISIDCPLLA
jgi:hypothetical protein